MATRDAEPVFMDTNVLVYAHVAEAPWHQEAQDVIAVHEAAGAPVWISPGPFSFQKGVANQA